MEKPLHKLFQVTDAANGPGPRPHGADGHGMFRESADTAEGPSVNPSIVLIAPDSGSMTLLRRAFEAQRATIIKEFGAYPTYAQLNSIIDLDSDAIIVEVDSDVEIAMDVVEAICARNPLATLMVYSRTGNTDLMARAMRAGARELLTATLGNTTVQEALVRAAARHSRQTKRVAGKAVVFWGAKGGSGVTTLATNFALALRMETSSEVSLLDLNPHLGDAAMLLGATPEFTLAEALNNAKRLDRDFVSTLLTRHSSGLSVLAAPDAYDPSVPVEARAIGKLLDVLRSQYPYVVVDAGRDLGQSAGAVVEMASTIYVVTQLEVPALRNAHRLISYIQRAGHQNVELVVNRYDPRKSDIDDDRVTKTLGLPPKWRIPNDYAAARRSANTGEPLIHEKSPAAAALRAMARAISGQPAAAEKKGRFSLFR